MSKSAASSTSIARVAKSPPVVAWKALITVGSISFSRSSLSLGWLVYLIFRACLESRHHHVLVALNICTRECTGFAGSNTGIEPFLAGLHESTGRAIAVITVSTLASVYASALALLKMLKFLVKVFKSLYLLNLWMDLVDIFPNVRCWSEVLCCTILTHFSDLEVKVMDFEILCLKFWLFLEVYII